MGITEMPLICQVIYGNKLNATHTHTPCNMQQMNVAQMRRSNGRKKKWKISRNVHIQEIWYSVILLFTMFVNVCRVPSVWNAYKEPLLNESKGKLNGNNKIMTKHMLAVITLLE